MAYIHRQDEHSEFLLLIWENASSEGPPDRIEKDQIERGVLISQLRKRAEVLINGSRFHRVELVRWSFDKEDYSDLIEEFLSS
jgi:hypothetical protein